MNAAEILEEIRMLPGDERRKIVGGIWEEFGDTDYGITDEQAAELDRRVAEHRNTPADVVEWSAIKADTRKRCSQGM